MKNGKYLFALMFSVLCVFRQVTANSNNSSDVDINNQQSNTSTKVSNAEANVSVESGKYFSVQNDISSNLLDRFPELTTIINKIVTNESKIVSSSNEDILNTSRLEVTEGVIETSPNQNNDSKAIQTKTIQSRYQPSIVLGYKPITSFYHPRPVTLAQIVPQGTPWPDSKDGYKTTKQNATQKVEEHTTFRVEIPQSTKAGAGHQTSIGTKPKSTTVSKTTAKEVESSTEHVIPPAIILDYKPITSFHHPHPVTLGQIVPTGTPWPDSIEGYDTSIGTKPKPTTVPKTTPKKVESSTEHVIPPAIILDYKPITSFHHPHPVTLGQIVPTGTPWPDSIEGYETSIGTKPKPTTVSKTTVKKVESSTQNVTPPATILEYQPITSFFHPNPVTPAQIIPSGTPWPDSLEGYQTSIGTKSPTSINKVDELQTTTKKQSTTVSKTTAKKVESSTQHVIPPATVLEYQPITSFFHPNPVTPAQIIPSGTPWPDSIEGYQTFIGTKPPALINKVDELQKITKKQPITISKTTVKEVKGSTQPATILEYQPITSFFHPNPVTPAQIIPSGTPWPDSVEGYKTSLGAKPSTSTNKVDEEETITKNKQTTVSKPTFQEMESSTQYIIPPLFVLGHGKPITSFYHPRPVTLAQIVPSGTPWPDSAEGYKTSIGTKTITSNQVNQEQITQEPTVGAVETNTNNLISAQTDLKYNPVTSFSKPWPDSSEGYETTTSSNKEIEVQSTARNNNFTPPSTVAEHKNKLIVAVAKIISPGGIDWPYPAGSNITNLEQTFLSLTEEISSNVKNETIGVTEITTRKPLKTKPVSTIPSEIVSDLLLENTQADLLKPNALQIELDVTDSADLTPIPFTSGTPKTTLSDVADILTEVYNITIVNSSSTAKPSEWSSRSNTTKVDLNYHDVLTPQENKVDKNKIELLVYDGVPKSEETINEERIFHNPKFDVKN